MKTFENYKRKIDNKFPAQYCLCNQLEEIITRNMYTNKKLT